MEYKDVNFYHINQQLEHLPKSTTALLFNLKNEKIRSKNKQG